MRVIGFGGRRSFVMAGTESTLAMLSGPVSISGSMSLSIINPGRSRIPVSFSIKETPECGASACKATPRAWTASASARPLKKNARLHRLEASTNQRGLEKLKA